jgi:hypothetical protein
MKESWELAEDFWKVNEMNDKIKKLAVKAQNNGDSIHYYDPVFAEKFAELIVRECAQIARGNEDDTTARQIESRFGVDE